jgi:cytochrome bd ubiquinol oxidase subunit II
MIELVAAVLLVAVAIYAITGGADFGSGFWDLVAGGPDRGERPRAIIEKAIGPVWEANHVWLIFIFVVLWTAFPEAYASITLTLFVPLTIAALGIVLRGSGFAFRKAVVRLRYRRIFGAAFASSSVIVPFCLGAVIGSVAAGEVPAGGSAGDPVSSWLNPAGIMAGVLAVTATIFLAAVYLTYESVRIGDDKMVEYFRIRAFAASGAAGVVSIVGIFVLRADAPYVFDGLTSRALPVVILAVFAGAASLFLLARKLQRGARWAAIVAVAALVFAWGIAQWDFVLPESLTIAEAGAPSGTLVALVVATIGGLLIVLPGFLLLYRLDQKGLLPEEGIAEEA